MESKTELEPSKIEELSVNDTTTNKSSADDTKVINEFTLAAAMQSIAKAYNKDFKKLQIAMPGQIHDGAVIDFADEDGRIVASAKLRLRNSVVSNEALTTMHVGAYLADLKIGRDVHSFTVHK